MNLDLKIEPLPILPALIAFQSFLVLYQQLQDVHKIKIQSNSFSSVPSCNLQQQQQKITETSNTERLSSIGTICALPLMFIHFVKVKKTKWKMFAMKSIKFNFER